MIEYIYDAIRAVAGQPISISAVITDATGAAIEEKCAFMLHDADGRMIAHADGEYLGEGQWQFNLPASMTSGLKGRHWYCIQHEDNNLCFMQPIYLV